MFEQKPKLFRYLSCQVVYQNICILHVVFVVKCYFVIAVLSGTDVLDDYSVMYRTITL